MIMDLRHPIFLSCCGVHCAHCLQSKSLGTTLVDSMLRLFTVLFSAQVGSPGLTLLWD